MCTYPQRTVVTSSTFKPSLVLANEHKLCHFIIFYAGLSHPSTDFLQHSSKPRHCPATLSVTRDTLCTHLFAPPLKRGSQKFILLLKRLHSSLTRRFEMISTHKRWSLPRKWLTIHLQEGSLRMANYSRADEWGGKNAE